MEKATQKDIMKYESTLPESFDGTFRFTNWSDEDFVGRWGGKDYIFPAESTSPMIIPEQTPIEVQHIRKKFAKDLAEREFYKSKKYKTLSAQEGTPGNRTMSGIHQAGTYSMTELTPFIQKCLEPLEITSAIVKETPKAKLEDSLSRNADGELNTEAIDSKKSLRAKALQS